MVSRASAHLGPSPVPTIRALGSMEEDGDTHHVTLGWSKLLLGVILPTA